MHTLHLIVVSVLLDIIMAVAPSTDSANPLYAQTGTHTPHAGIYTLSTGSSYNSAITIFNPQTFTIPFSRNEPSSSYHLGYNIHEIDYYIVGQTLNLSVIIGSKTATDAQFMVYASNANKLKVCKISYAIIEPIFDVYTFSYHWMQPQVTLVNGQFYEETSTGYGPFNMTSISIWSTLTGIDVTLTNNQIDLYVAVTVPNAISIHFRFSTISNQAFQLHSCILGAYIYNTGDSSYTLRSASFVSASFNNFGGSSYSNSKITTTNTILGTQSYHITNQAAYQYSLTISNGQIAASTNVTVSYMQFSYLILTFAQCPTGNSYLSLVDNTCYSSCPIRTSTNAYYQQCYACPTYDCQYCNITGLCTSCRTADNRQMDGSNRCVPKAGYYDDGTSLAKPCTANCVACTGSTNCQQCSLGYSYTLANNSCWLDCTTIESCSSCHYSSGLICDSCSAPYTINSNLCTSTSCGQSNCIYCTASQCIHCQNGYTLSGGTCTFQATAVCGDGVISTGQNCDDGNVLDYDGCSVTCQVEDNYQCSGQPSKCVITAWQMNKVSVLKDPGDNVFTISFEIEPARNQIYETIYWLASISQSRKLPIIITSIQYTKNSNHLVLIASYNQSVSKQHLALTFTPPNVAVFAAAAISPVSATLTADNNLALDYYQSQIYTTALIVKICSGTLGCLALVLFVLGYYAGKMVAVQTVCMFQLTFYALAGITDLSPAFDGLTYLQYSKGYNFQIITPQSNIDRVYQPLSLVFQFFSNYNLMFATILIPLIISLVLFFTNRCIYKQQNVNHIRLYLLLAGEFTLYGLVFSLYTVTMAGGIVLGKVDENLEGSIIGLSLLSLMIIIYIIYMVLFVKIQQIMGEFTSNFLKDAGKPSQKYLPFYLYLIINMIVQAGSLNLLFFQPRLVIILVLLTIKIMILVKKKPYNESQSRPVLNTVISGCILALILFYPYVRAQMPAYGSLAPLLILVLLLIVLIYSSYYVVKEIKYKWAANKVTAAQKSKHAMFDVYLASTESKRVLKSKQKSLKEKIDESIMNLDEDAKSVSTSPKNKRKKMIEELNDEEVKRHIQHLNADFLISSPYIHAFRSNPTALKGSRKAVIPSSPKPKQSQNLMSQLQKLKDSLNQGRRQRRKLRQAPDS